MPISKPADLTDQVAIVTGAARGIGQACAVALAGAGADVVVADVLPGDETVAKVRELGRRAIFLATDVTSRAAVEALMQRAIAEFGRIDILVNNAGTLGRVGIEDTTDAIWDRDLNTTLRGSFYCIQAVLPHMKERGSGKIVNISSISGKIGGVASRAAGSDRGRSGPAYAAAKGGLLALTKWVAKDVGRHGIYVNAVAPSGVESDMTRGFDYGVENYPIARMGQPEDIAQAVVFLASQASNYITGAILDVNGGIV
ncbi:MAG: SDR family oxidoreductase [Planctomycetes bacterium]|nr:SDR family oxidoreductase [Planctomycetota bacterium]